MAIIEGVIVNQLSLADAGEFLRGLDAASVDLVVSSPPYFIGKEYDKSNNVDDFLAESRRILQELLRVVKSGGSICWQVGNHVSKKELIPLDALIYSVFSVANQLTLRNRIIWTFGHGAHCSTRFSGRHETILWFTKGDGYYFDLDAVRVPQKYPGKRHYKGPHYGKPSGNPLGKNPGDVWDIPNVKSRHVEKTEHPCQFPVGLAQRLIRALCPPTGIVADPYMGAGSTAIAAAVEGRRFVGCDLNEKYVEIARTRLLAFAGGTLRIRPLDMPIQGPQQNHAVARVPDEWHQLYSGD